MLGGLWIAARQRGFAVQLRRDWQLPRQHLLSARCWCRREPRARGPRPGTHGQYNDVCRQVLNTALCRLLLLLLLMSQLHTDRCCSTIRSTQDATDSAMHDARTSSGLCSCHERGRELLRMHLHAMTTTFTTSTTNTTAVSTTTTTTTRTVSGCKKT